MQHHPAAYALRLCRWERWNCALIFLYFTKSSARKNAGGIILLLLLGGLFKTYDDEFRVRGKFSFQVETHEKLYLSFFRVYSKNFWYCCTSMNKSNGLISVALGKITSVYHFKSDFFEPRQSK
jgi:CDP-diglyceride synthetase